jgi:uncharacterized protein (TIGR02646 family)
MKYIEKGDPPAELLKWQRSDKKFQKGVGIWRRVPGHVRTPIRQALLEEQGYLCCYCEKAIVDDQYHVEHIQPQGVPATEHLGANYDNILCSCLKDTATGEPLHCGRAKQHWYDEALYISPLSPDCEQKFRYSYDGRILPADSTDSATIATIDHLKLDIPKLKALRKATIDPFLDPSLSPEDIDELTTSYLVDKVDNGGRFNEYYTMIKYLFG